MKIEHPNDQYAPKRIKGREPLTPNPDGVWPIVDISVADFRKQYEASDLALCACLDWLWLGVVGELSAQACPRCDGRVADWGSPDFTERLQARTTDEARACPTCHNLCHSAARLTREGTEK